jgi:hypothetical protein
VTLVPEAEIDSPFALTPGRAAAGPTVALVEAAAVIEVEEGVAIAVSVETLVAAGDPVGVSTSVLPKLVGALAAGIPTERESPLVDEALPVPRPAAVAVEVPVAELDRVGGVAVGL